MKCSDTATLWHVRIMSREAAGGAGGAGLSELLELLPGFTPVFQALPPRAAVAEVAGALRYFGVGPVELAQRLRLRAAALYGMPLSVGIGRSWAVAAMASAHPGPTGLLYVPPSRTATFLDPLPVEDLYGIRRAQAAALRGLGLSTVGLLAAAPGATVARILGARAGRELQERARGTDPRTPRTGLLPRSTSARTDFTADTLDGPRLRAEALGLAAGLGTRLRGRGEAARSLTVRVRLADRAEVTCTRALPAASAHTEDLRATVYQCLDALALQRARIRRVTVTAEDLCDRHHAPTQLSLDAERENRLRAEPVMDALNTRYGPGTVGPASVARREAVHRLGTG
ncbi:hypothetical protein ACFXDJ_07250 [Streptomyces sp. NPDC059443]|uniref:DNA polymerase Y family protein n=1 Tax=unclassified Streptomyces TaxID=2593676 RepID=UPI0036A93B04